ncbi:MAG: TRAP transporter substrate-binding protein [Bradyrhizobiaceae bacterium]|nr:TRAP transporter substrate-binding protein [Bradyrhizobiaceae bacterium]
MRHQARLVSAFLLSNALALTMASASNAEERVTWRMQSGYPATLSVIGDTAKHLTETVERMTGGNFKIRYLEPNALVPSPQIFDAVGAGRVELGYSWSGFQAGKIPAINVFTSVPFGPGPDVHMAWLHEGGGKEIVEELYAPFNVHSIPCGLLPAEASGWFRKEVTSLDQLRGMKIRIVGLAADAIKKFGASPTLIPAGEIFLNLERGVIDATEFSLPSIDKDLGFYKVTKHYYFPGWHQPSSTLELLINKKNWDALTPANRAILETACGDSMRFAMARSLSEQAKAMEFLQKQGVIFHKWPDEMLAAFRKASLEVMEEHSSKDPNFKRAWTSMKNFMDRTKLWSDVAVSRD